MREIKFRAWNAETEEMFSHEQIIGMTKEIIPIYKDLPVEPPAILLPVSQKHIKLMQYTGTCDKWGDEIYEGDYLEDNYGDAWCVIWKEGGFYLDNIYTANPPTIEWAVIYEDIEEYFEIIGNIYELEEPVR